MGIITKTTECKNESRGSKNGSFDAVVVVDNDDVVDVLCEFPFSGSMEHAIRPSVPTINACCAEVKFPSLLAEATANVSSSSRSHSLLWDSFFSVARNHLHHLIHVTKVIALARASASTFSAWVNASTSSDVPGLAPQAATFRRAIKHLVDHQ